MLFNIWGVDETAKHALFECRCHVDIRRDFVERVEAVCPTFRSVSTDARFKLAGPGVAVENVPGYPIRVRWIRPLRNFTTKPINQLGLQLYFPPAKVPVLDRGDKVGRVGMIGIRRRQHEHSYRTTSGSRPDHHQPT